MTYVETEIRNNEEEFWKEDIKPKRVLGLTRIKIARAIRLRLIEIPKGIKRPRRAA